MATPHDFLFRFTFGQPRQAAGWLRTVLPAPLVAAIDWATLRTAPEKVHGQPLRLLITDTVFDVGLLRTGQGLFVLLEHKSYVDPNASAQLLRYSVHLAHSTRADGERPALVAPILLCHGRTAWPDEEPPHPHLQGLEPEAAAALAAVQARMRLLIDDRGRLICLPREHVIAIPRE